MPIFRNAILGMNARNAVFLRENKHSARALADQKLRTKEVLREHELPVAKLIAAIHRHKETFSFPWETLPTSFVIKPNRGFGGEGILVIFNHLKNGNWLSTNRRQLSTADLIVHVLNILDGNYSFANTPDSAIFEERLAPDPLYKKFSPDGLPDIRIIVYNRVPIMAMLRVPTQRSHGKANLHQGGIGVGIDVTTGLTTHAVIQSLFFEHEIDRHPDTLRPLRGIKIPYWSDILKTALRATQAVGLKFSGVDIAVDKRRGPVILELNARPGLGIQLANMTALQDRLERIRGLKVKSIDHGIAIAKELFAGFIEEEVETITGRQIIGLLEKIIVEGKDKRRASIIAKIDTGADRSSIDMQLARDLGFGESIDCFSRFPVPENISSKDIIRFSNEWELKIREQCPDISGLSDVHSSHGSSVRIRIPLKIILSGYEMNIEATVFDRSQLQHPFLIGRRSLSHFLIDTTKQKSSSNNTSPSLSINKKI